MFSIAVHFPAVLPNCTEFLQWLMRYLAADGKSAPSLPAEAWLCAINAKPEMRRNVLNLRKGLSREGCLFRAQPLPGTKEPDNGILTCSAPSQKFVRIKPGWLDGLDGFIAWWGRLCWNVG